MKWNIFSILYIFQQEVNFDIKRKLHKIEYLSKKPKHSHTIFRLGTKPNIWKHCCFCQLIAQELHNNFFFNSGKRCKTCNCKGPLAKIYKWSVYWAEHWSCLNTSPIASTCVNWGIANDVLWHQLVLSNAFLRSFNIVDISGNVEKINLSKEYFEVEVKIKQYAQSEKMVVQAKRLLRTSNAGIYIKNASQKPNSRHYFFRFICFSFD